MIRHNLWIEKAFKHKRQADGVKNLGELLQGMAKWFVSLTQKYVSRPSDSRARNVNIGRAYSLPAFALA
jgi:hypothetical protein